MYFSLLPARSLEHRSALAAAGSSLGLPLESRDGNWLWRLSRSCSRSCSRIRAKLCVCARALVTMAGKAASVTFGLAGRPVSCLNGYFNSAQLDYLSLGPSF